MKAHNSLKHYLKVSVVLSLATVFLAGCQLFSSKQPTFDPGSGTGMEGVRNQPPGEGDEIDKIHPGDSLTITVSDYGSQPPQNIVEDVKQDGTVKVMLLDKSFVAAEKSRSQLEKEIHDFYVPGYYQQMTVSVQLEKQSRFYYVDGEVKSPGRQVYIGRMSVLRAVTSAGGFTDYANKGNVLLTHPDGRIEHVNCKKALAHPEQDLSVFPGDRIYIKRRILF